MIDKFLYKIEKTRLKELCSEHSSILGKPKVLSHKSYLSATHYGYAITTYFPNILIAQSIELSKDRAKARAVVNLRQEILKLLHTPVNNVVKSNYSSQATTRRNFPQSSSNEESYVTLLSMNTSDTSAVENEMLITL